MKPFIRRLIFVLLTTAVQVFFSEKAYWYPQGYVISELILFYAVPVYATLWAVDYFRVRTLSEIVLIAALYAFLVEGVLTPVIYEAGLLDPIMPAYFVGWHGLLSVLLGWYFYRKWLVQNRWKRLLLGSVLFGIFWGVWSLSYWLPENMAEFENGGQWPPLDFALYAFAFTFVLVLGHGLLALGGWKKRFKPSRIEKWGVVLTLIFFFATLAFPAAPLGILKLMALGTAVFLPLYFRLRRGKEGSVLLDLAGPIKPINLLFLFLMPTMATAVYLLAYQFKPADAVIQTIFELVPVLQSLVGAGAFVWAVAATLWPLRPKSVNDTAAPTPATK